MYIRIAFSIELRLRVSRSLANYLKIDHNAHKSYDYFVHSVQGFIPQIFKYFTLSKKIYIFIICQVRSNVSTPIIYIKITIHNVLANEHFRNYNFILTIIIYLSPANWPIVH